MQSKTANFIPNTKKIQFTQRLPLAAVILNRDPTTIDRIRGRGSERRVGETGSAIDARSRVAPSARRIFLALAKSWRGGTLGEVAKTKGGSTRSVRIPKKDCWQQAQAKDEQQLKTREQLKGTKRAIFPGWHRSILRGLLQASGIFMLKTPTQVVIYLVPPKEQELRYIKIFYEQACPLLARKSLWARERQIPAFFPQQTIEQKVWLCAKKNLTGRSALRAAAAVWFQVPVARLRSAGRWGLRLPYLGSCPFEGYYHD
ncbi:hypothetical protein AgCh_020339 [Apium graveolens]